MRSEPSEPSIEVLLRELHAPRVEPPTQHDIADVGELEALAAWSQRYAKPPEPDRVADGSMGAGLLGLLSMLGRHRLAVALAAMLMAVVGACVLPTSYEIPLGTSIEIHIVDGELASAQEIARYVHERSDAAEVDVLMRELVHDGGTPQIVMLIRLWDHELPLGEIIPELREQFPELENAEITETALEGEIDTIWARRLAHRAFSLSLREVDVEQARHQLVLELQSRGFEDDEIVVKVRDRADGHREIEVQVERRDIDGQHEHGTDAATDPFDLHGLGPGFQWVMDPDRPEHVELPAPAAGSAAGSAIQVHVQPGDEQ
jgi:hypothetical protein